MKKPVIGAACAALLGATATAHAQSSVALYGLLDASIAYTNNQSGKSAWQQGSGLLSNTVFGLSGNEDLGGAWHALFRLESGVNVNNGSSSYKNTVFGRRAYVGLRQDDYGTLTFGRQYDSVVDCLGPIALANNGDGNNLAAHPFDNDNIDDSFYIDNAVKYASPTIAGMQLGAVYGFSNQAGFSGNRAYSVGLSYGNGPVNLAAAYLQLNRGGTTANGALSTNDAPNFPAARQRVMGAGGSYTFGRATLGALWTHTMLDDTAAASLPGAMRALRFDNYEINARYALTPAVSFAGAYTFTDGRYDGAATGRPKWHQVTLMADYALSKRTDVYAQGVYQHQFGVPSDAALGFASINGLGASSTNTQVAATVGIRHRF
ncbi:gram-negative porin family protein [Burkholderia thailandensis E264]|uniref:Outer membrane porin OpcP n=1 Tax=Burkholderia thailandensis (strain ATCC 700388 / DSM 13276 / CCUG 48851 / CIP 106301 / E264) TaxID=271848 RepID=Q2SUR0_BURTA|nr:porin [Burkholderia thailandensis]ABC38650.1 outer membrane porin OpcP [Burkholderia thailandensis E264]AHI72989.1 gram-negative porin family protein [Burkholderia thailandensis 2002721723]AIP25814.1 gram-negative porin family protein [Burkholderia thailandensis E264]AJX98284.1 gram-negative porin family protein [Burkholderia thailandensis 2002721643]NBC93077.1 porin [Burkholderia thailandensis]